MSVSPPSESAGTHVALVGNPNSGKTTLFNALTGLNHKVGNYPGVTVERREGSAADSEGSSLRLLDLPGTYSLTSRSPDEQIAVEVLLGECAGEDRPDVILNVCDASNLSRNLFLTTQLLELGLPVVVALSNVDRLDTDHPLRLNPALLSSMLGVPCIAVDARRSHGMKELTAALRAVEGQVAPRVVVHDPALEELAAESGGTIAFVVHDLLQHGESPRRRALDEVSPEWWKQEAAVRYQWIDDNLARIEEIGRVSTSVGRSERVDRLLLHRLIGPVAFLGIMGLMFQLIFAWSAWPMEQLELVFAWLSESASWLFGTGLFGELVVDGALAGVLNVVIFLPQILLLFFVIGLLEDSGYMARAAVIMDRMMRGVGLHGQAFVPLLSSFACAVPGILATRTIADRPSRLTTMLVAPLMSCSARLPVYTLVIGAFFADREIWGGLNTAGLVMTGLYVVGVVAALLMAKLFRSTLAKGPTPPLILELPPYRLPSLRNVLRDLSSRGWLFVKRAGTVILVFSVILWGLQRFPRHAETTARFEAERASLEAELESAAMGRAVVVEAELAQIDTRLAASRSEESFAGSIGHAIEPVLRPLGFDWRIGVGIIASLAAREVFVAGMSCVFSVEDGEDTGFTRLQSSLANARDSRTGARSYSPLTGVSLLIFFCLACQCVATLAAIRRETGSWRWPTFTFVYMTALAWLASFVVYQGGLLLGF